MKKVNQYHYRPGQALELPGGCGSHISRQSAHEGDKVSPTHRPPLPPRKYSRYAFLLETVNPRSVVRLEGCVEPATLRLVAQCLQLRHSVHHFHALDCVWNVMAHAQKPDYVFRRNGRVHLSRQGRQFSRLLAAEVCASAVVMLDTPCSEVVWRVLATHSIRQFPLHFPFRASPCAITFQLGSTNVNHSHALEHNVLWEIYINLGAMNWPNPCPVSRRHVLEWPLCNVDLTCCRIPSCLGQYGLFQPT